ncbi:MAG: tetratricopeptide repeat protein [Smithella sp.]|nr:tetratricopeptide repeat protein [Smithella sp.]
MKQEDLVKGNKYNLLVLMSVLIITAIVFSGSLNSEWTNWDDNLLVYQNPLVKEPNLKDIFTKPAIYNTYNPLVILSFALEWKIVQDRPFLYHLNNLLLHIVCTALVWLLFMRLGLSIWWSGFAALLFGIHPMRVESVVWISERKDLLFGLFYLTSLLTYIRYIFTGKNSHLLIVFLLFIVSLLVKGQAVAMPLTMILLDWYLGRKISMKAALEKVVFFVLSIIFSIMTVTFFVKNAYTPADQTTIMHVFNYFEQMVLGGYAYTVYILKVLIPYSNSPLYPMPESLQLKHWIGGVIAICIFLSAFMAWRKVKYITFGILFYTFNVFFLLMPFLMSETAFLFDHYTNIAYIGLFFVMAMSLQKVTIHLPSHRFGVVVFAVFLLAFYVTLTIRYIPVWKNSETLWTYVIEKYPDKMAVAHLNRGNDRYASNQLDAAMYDFNKAIDINPAYAPAYMNRSLLYLERNENQKALEDYNHYMELVSPYDAKGNLLNSMLSDSYRHRGAIHFKMAHYEKALHDFSTAIEYDPLSFDNYMNRALAYMQLGMYEKAIRDFTLCHQSAPGNSDILNNRGVCYLRLNNLESALEDFSGAIRINDHNPSYLTNRAMVYQKMGRQEEANQDLSIAEKTKSNFNSSLKKSPQ